MEFLLAIALTFYCLGVLKFSLSLNQKSARIKSIICLIYLFLLICHLFNLIYSNCHLVLGCTLAAPGSYITRGMVIETSAFIRRMIEPSILLIIFCQFYLVNLGNNKTNSKLRISLLIIVFTIICEALTLANQIFLESDSLMLTVAPYIISLGWSVSFLLTGYALIRTRTKQNFTSRSFPFAIFFYLIGLTLGILNITDLTPSKISAKTAAHYYVWFPENWIAGYGELEPELKSKPLLGEYLSDHEDTINNHFKQFSENKIDYIFLDWWPTKRSLRNRAKFFVNNIPNGSNVKFALHFETQGIDKNEHFLNINEKNIHKLEAHFVYLAKTFFNHPNYLTINGKKVVNIYITRHILGDFGLAIEKIRYIVKNETGHDMYLIGDEAFFNVVTGPNDKSQILLHEYIPEWDRINALDAITLYNPYDPTYDYGETPEEIQENFLARTEDLFREYYKIAVTAGKPFIPGIIPGYNDKAIRPDEKHLIIPRNINSKNTLNVLKRTARETISMENYDLTTITSWNEWNEGTNIEPSSTANN